MGKRRIDWRKELLVAKKQLERNKALIEAGETYAAHKPSSYTRVHKPKG